MTAAAIAPVDLTPAQELYRLEKARKIERDAPVLAAAALELQRQAEQAEANRKGGRPRGPALNLGARGRPRRRSSEPEPEMPGRPERLAMSSLHFPTSPARRAIPPMPSPSIEKACRRSGQMFAAGSNGAKFCHTCPECRAAESDTKPPRRETKATKPETSRRRVETGYKPQSHSSGNGDGYGAILEDLAEKLHVLDRKRVQLVTAIESIRNLDGGEE